jgi:large subunit ribosomal protein L24
MVVIEKINMIKRHTKPSQDNPTGGIIEKEAPLHVSKVLPVGKSGKPMRISKWLREGSREAAAPQKASKSAKGKERGAK